MVASERPTYRHKEDRSHTDSVYMWSGSNWRVQEGEVGGKKEGHGVRRMNGDWFPIHCESSGSLVFAGCPSGSLTYTIVIKQTHHHPPSSHRALLEIHYQPAVSVPWATLPDVCWNSRDESHTHKHTHTYFLRFILSSFCSWLLGLLCRLILSAKWLEPCVSCHWAAVNTDQCRALLQHAAFDSTTRQICGKHTHDISWSSIIHFTLLQLE